ncbi:MAG: hydrogenase maturation nickel metallochaperone HypA [Armatimonadetes bacterium]|nr:hydrogenase maturation nickel metallochaperone HypA [Armatimonadota bacterium]
MHELSAVQNILQIVLEEAAKARAKRITRVVVKVGKWSTFVPSAIRFYFNILAEGTPAEGAHLEVDVVPISYRCQECDCVYEPCLESSESPGAAEVTDEDSFARWQPDAANKFTLNTDATSSLPTMSICDSGFQISDESQEEMMDLQQTWRDSFLCPVCGGAGKLLRGLEELYVDYIEVENADQPSSQDI